METPLPSLHLLYIGCRAGKRVCRRTEQEETLPDAIGPVARDGDGRVVFVDLDYPEGKVKLEKLKQELRVAAPTLRFLERAPLINRSRVLYQIHDPAAHTAFVDWFVHSTVQLPPLREMLAPLGKQLCLLGMHYIAPRVSTAYEPYIRQQEPHTDIDSKREVMAVGLHVFGEKMNTLLDPTAFIDDSGAVVPGDGLKRAYTNTFIMDVGAVHAGPGKAHVEGPYPRFLIGRVFIMVCSAKLPAERVAKHRRDNDFVAPSSELVFEVWS